MEAHHQQTNAPVMHQQHTVIEQRNPDVSIKNRSGGGSTKSTKKRKRNQDLGPGAPRQPVNGKTLEFVFYHIPSLWRLDFSQGYVRFLNERREQVRAANPSAGFADIMKIMAQEWTQLPAEEKQKYMQAAEQDRQRYQKELQEYQQTEAYKSYVQLQQQQHVQQQLHLQQQQRQAMQAAHQPQSQVRKVTDLLSCSIDGLFLLLCLSWCSSSSSRQRMHLTAKFNLSSTFNKFKRTTLSCILYSTCNSLGSSNTSSNSNMVIEVIMLVEVTGLIVQGTKLARLTFPSSLKSFLTTIKVCHTHLKDYNCRNNLN